MRRRRWSPSRNLDSAGSQREGPVWAPSHSTGSEAYSAAPACLPRAFTSFPANDVPGTTGASERWGGLKLTSLRHVPENPRRLPDSLLRFPSGCSSCSSPRPLRSEAKRSRRSPLPERASEPLTREPFLPAAVPCGLGKGRSPDSADAGHDWGGSCQGGRTDMGGPGQRLGAGDGVPDLCLHSPSPPPLGFAGLQLGDRVHHLYGSRVSTRRSTHICTCTRTDASHAHTSCITLATHTPRAHTLNTHTHTHPARAHRARQTAPS